MPSRNARWLLAACLLALGPPAANCAPPSPVETKIGIFNGGRQDPIALGRALGVRYERLILAVNGSDGHQLATIKAAEAAGFRLNVQFNNLAPTAGSRARSGRVSDDASYEQELAAGLDETHPDVVTIQNEEDGLQFWNGTPQDYLHELADAVRVAHAKGYRISNGGVTGVGVKLAYWHHLWVSGQHAAADAFAQRSLDRATLHNHMIADDIPDSAHPDRPVLAASEPMRNKLERVETLLAGYRATGVDYINFHWYQNSPDDLRAVATWLSQTTGLPAICNEMGQYGNDPATVAGLLAAARSLHLAYVMWFAVDGKGPAFGLVDQNGALRANGQAFRSLVASQR
jgi:hypothetical protein